MRTEKEIVAKWEELKKEFKSENLSLSYLAANDEFCIEKGNDLYYPPTLDALDAFLTGYKHGWEVGRG